MESAEAKRQKQTCAHEVDFATAIDATVYLIGRVVAVSWEGLSPSHGKGCCRLMGRVVAISWEGLLPSHGKVCSKECARCTKTMLKKVTWASCSFLSLS